MIYSTMEEFHKAHPLASTPTHIHAFHPYHGCEDKYVHNDAFMDNIRGILSPYWVNGFIVVINTGNLEK